MKVALDIHEISMLKNKIYQYLSREILKNFITILLTFTLIAWVVRAVNFLDLIVDDGYGSYSYLKYSLLNLTSIMTNFIPLSFLISLTISIIKFEKQQELLILWTTGLSKMKIVNIFILISILVTLFHISMSAFINPLFLNKSRSLLSETGTNNVTSLLRVKDFSDTFKGVTFYIDKKNADNELINVLIKDTGGNLASIKQKKSLPGERKFKSTTIIAEKGIASEGKLTLFNGIMQRTVQSNKSTTVYFKKNELNLNNVATRTVKKTKIQETSSKILVECIFNFNNLIIRNCSKNFKIEAIQTMTGRLGSPLYTPLTSIIISFLLIYQKEKKLNFLKKYLLFILSFIVLVLTRIFLKYTGFNYLAATSYFIFPVIIFFLFYIFLSKKTRTEKT